MTCPTRLLNDAVARIAWWCDRIICLNRLRLKYCFNLVGRYAPAHKVESCTPIGATPASTPIIEFAKKWRALRQRSWCVDQVAQVRSIGVLYHDQSPRQSANFCGDKCGLSWNMLEAKPCLVMIKVPLPARASCPGKFWAGSRWPNFILAWISEMGLRLRPS